MIENYKPAVNKWFLLFLSGTLWIVVAVVLDTFAVSWLLKYHGPHVWVFPTIGFLAALVIHHFGFLRVVDRNLRRISRMEAKSCVFAFMSWKNYLIVLMMMGMGMALRHSSIPKQYLSILYIGMGMALFLSSVRYFRVLWTQYRHLE